MHVPSNFPSIDEIVDDFVCKSAQVTIEGEEGLFYGPVSLQTDLPSGYGAFAIGDVIHFGCVKNGIFTDGSRVTINKEKVWL